ncbi:MAG: sigma-70 family RNA polymerase sigma factor [Planctomycetota bacterium]|nr:MAG: sigma-70 family RNA polymerase sigma factor [Planctomycetota bacterium]
MGVLHPQTGPAAPDGDAQWHDLVSWAESNLRGQIERSLPAGGPISATTVIHSALRRTVERRARLRHGMQHAQAFLAGIAKRVRSEKFRRERRLCRSPEGAVVVALADGEAAGAPAESPLWGLVLELPPNLRELLESLYREGLTFREYAARSGKSEKQVERMHQRALEQLRRLSRSAEEPV